MKPDSALAACLLLMVMSVAAVADTCDRCQSSSACRKVCRLKCEQREVEVTCWGCKTEEFCLPCPSEPGCKHSETICAECNPGDQDKEVQTAPKKFVWTDWIPTGAKLRTKKMLMMKKEKKLIPSYRWVIEDLCENCRREKEGKESPETSPASQADAAPMPAPAPETHQPLASAPVH